MALIAHTFRISQETLDDLKRLGNGNESKGCRIALKQAGEKQTKAFAWGVLAGLAGSVIAHLVLWASLGGP